MRPYRGKAIAELRSRDTDILAASLADQTLRGCTNRGFPTHDASIQLSKTAGSTSAQPRTILPPGGRS
jgi:hypothetical protein